jgi:hypothetical protein
MSVTYRLYLTQYTLVKITSNTTRHVLPPKNNICVIMQRNFSSVVKELYLSDSCMLLCTLLCSVIPIFRTFLKRSVLTVLNVEMQFFMGYYGNCPYQWLRDLKGGSGTVCLQGLCVLMPLGAWMSLSCECCQAEVSVASRSLIQRSPTECVWCVRV